MKIQKAALVKLTAGVFEEHQYVIFKKDYIANKSEDEGDLYRRDIGKLKTKTTMLIKAGTIALIDSYTERKGLGSLAKEGAGINYTLFLSLVKGKFAGKDVYIRFTSKKEMLSVLALKKDFKPTDVDKLSQTRDGASRQCRQCAEYEYDRGDGSVGMEGYEACNSNPVAATYNANYDDDAKELIQILFGLADKMQCPFFKKK